MFQLALPERPVQPHDNAGALRNPPELVGVEPWVDAAIDRKARTKAKGDSAMSAAYRKAKRAA